MASPPSSFEPYVQLVDVTDTSALVAWGGSDVRLLLHGHEHNLQHGRVDDLDYIVSGAGGKLQVDPPTGFADGGTQSWAAEPHCLLVEVDQDRIAVTPYGGTPPGGQPTPVVRHRPDGEPTDAAIVLRR